MKLSRLVRPRPLKLKMWSRTTGELLLMLSAVVQVNYDNGALFITYRDEYDRLQTMIPPVDTTIEIV